MNLPPFTDLALLRIAARRRRYLSQNLNIARRQLSLNASLRRRAAIARRKAQRAALMADPSHP